MAKRPSLSALKIARVTVWLSRRPETADLLPPRCGQVTAALLRAGGFLKDWHERVYDSRVFGKITELSERWMAPGQAVGIALRKRFMDDEVRAAIADGATQVLVLGAGLDTLALRLCTEFPEVTFLEIDHPASQAAKRSCLARLDPPGNLHLCPVDLARVSLEAALREHAAWSVHERGIAVAEGLLMYLTEPGVTALFEGVRAASGPGSRIVFSYLPAGHDGRGDLGNAGIIKASAALVGEPWTWFLRDLDGFLRARGYHLLGPPGRGDVAARYLGPLGRGNEPAGLERFAVAETQ